MKLKHSPTYLTSLQLYAALIGSGKGYKKIVTIEEATNSGWGKESTAKEQYTIRQELTIVEHGVLKSLSANALKLVIRLMDELCMNNALWEFKPITPRDYTAVKELRDKHILLKTEDNSIHYVNPIQIRRGGVMSVVAQTTHVLESVSRVHRELIRDLSYSSVKLSRMDQLGL